MIMKWLAKTPLTWLFTLVILLAFIINAILIVKTGHQQLMTDLRQAGEKFVDYDIKNFQHQVSLNILASNIDTSTLSPAEINSQVINHVVNERKIIANYLIFAALDKQGRILYANNKAWQGKLAVKQFKAFKPQQLNNALKQNDLYLKTTTVHDSIIVYANIPQQNKTDDISRPYTLFAYYDLKKDHHDGMQGVWQSVTKSIVVFFLMTVLVIILFRTLLAKPLKKLIKITQNIALGKFSPPTEQQNSQEVTELSQAINEMSLALQRQFTLNQQHNKQILLEAERAQALLELPKYLEQTNETEFLQHFLSLAEKLTDSVISFAHFIKSNQQTIDLTVWSKNTLANYCHVIDKTRNPIHQTGIWADACQQQQAIICNDNAHYPEQNNLPEPHFSLHRLITLPVINHNQVVMLVGIGNRTALYQQHHVDTLQLLANETWRLLQQKKDQAHIQRVNYFIEHSFTEFYSFNDKTLQGIDINLAASTNLGYSKKEFQQKNLLDFSPEFSIDKIKQLLAPLRTRELKKLETCSKLYRKDGSSYPVELEAMLSNEQPALLLITCRDISEKLAARKREKQQSLQREALVHEFRNFFNLPTNLHMITDIYGNIQKANSAWHSQLGYSEQQLLGESIFDFTHPDDIKAVKTMLKSLGDHQTIKNVTNLFRHINGNYLLLSWSAKFSAAEKKLYISAFDVTEQEATIAQMRKLAHVVEQSPGSIMITDKDAHIEYVNQQFIDSTGYTFEEVLGKNPRLLQSDKTPIHTYQTMWKTIKHGKTWQGELYNQRKDGSQYIEFAIISPIIHQDTGISHYVAVKEDITEKKRLGLELDQHRNHLEELVERRTQELEKERKNAEAANQAKSAFLANMSHEIRTPMNAIIGITHLMQRENLNLLQRKRLNQIDGATKHLLNIINDILDLSKIEANKLELEQKPFNLKAVFDQITTMLTQQIQANKLTLIIDIDEQLNWLIGDITRLRQAILNFTSNALKFTKQGTITIQAKVITKEQQQLLIKFIVSDTGVGIAADVLPTIFEEFQQADVSTTRNYGGTGLGLAINQRIAKLMGGEIGVNSELGKGSTFWFTGRFTAITEQIKQTVKLSVHEIQQQLRQHCHQLKLLLVEDNELNRDVAAEIMANAGLTIDQAENGEQAVAKIKQQHYDLVLMDLQMPIMDGFQATTLIRQHFNAEQLPILAFSANIFTQERERCIAVGMNDFVAKPIEIDIFFEVLARWLPLNINVGGVDSITIEPESLNNETIYTTSNLTKNTTNNSLLSSPDTLNKASASEANENKNNQAEQNIITLLNEVEGLDLTIALANMNNDAKALLRILIKFTKTHGDDAKQINTLFQANKLVECKRVSHTLKGSSGTIGLTRIQHFAQELEILFSENSELNLNNNERCTELRAELFVELDFLQSHIKELQQQQLYKPTTTIVDNSSQIMAEIQTLLNNNDTQAIAIFSYSEAMLRQHYARAAQVDTPDDLITQLSNELDSFDFEQALITSKQICQAQQRQTAQNGVTTAQNSREQTDPHPPTAMVINIAVLQQLYKNDEIKQRQLLEKFIKQTTDIINTINKTQKAKQADEIAFQAHKLKSSAKMVGAMQLAELCLHLETLAKEGFSKELSQLSLSLPQALNDIKSWLSKNLSSKKTNRSNK